MSQTCAAGVCIASGPSPVFASKFTKGTLAGSTLRPDGAQLAGPANTNCGDNYGSSGIQVQGLFACKFTVGAMMGQTIVPTGSITLSGPEGAPCDDNYGNTGTQTLQFQ
jgi:hypothetical protein